MEPVDLDGRVLFSPEAVEGGEVGPDTEFRFRQSGDMVWGRYSGGGIRMGFFVGTSDGATLHFRYTQLNTRGETASGSTTDRIELLDDGGSGCTSSGRGTPGTAAAPACWRSAAEQRGAARTGQTLRPTHRRCEGAPCKPRWSPTSPPRSPSWTT